MKHRPFWQGALLFTLALAVGAGLGLVAFARSYSALIEVKGKSLVAQGEAMAALIGGAYSSDSATATGEAGALPPDRVAPILRRLAPGPDTRAHVYDRNGTLLFDSAGVPVHAADKRSTGETLSAAWIRIVGWFIRGGSLPSRTTGSSGREAYPEVRTAIADSAPATQLLVENGEEVVSVAVPISSRSAVHGVLLLSTRAGI